MGKWNSDYLKEIYLKHKNILKFILLMFLLSRALLLGAGFLSKSYYGAINPEKDIWKFSENVFVDMWAIWDSGFYLDIAKRGYADDQNFEFPVLIEKNDFGPYQKNFHFFPLYPIFIRALNYFVKDFLFSGLIVSNVFLLLSAFVLYKLTLLHYSELIAKRSVKFLFLFPTSFIYSGVFSESLALFLILTTTYFAENKKWIKSGIFAGLSFLTKSSGIIGLFTMILAPKNLKDMKFYFSLVIPVFLASLFFYYHYTTTGNPLIYFETAINGWGVKFINPLQTAGTLLLFKTTLGLSILKNTALTFFFLEIFLLYVFYKKSNFPGLSNIYRSLGGNKINHNLKQRGKVFKSKEGREKKINFNLWLVWLAGLIIPTSSGFAAFLSLPRHALLLFPQFIALSLISENPVANKLLSITLLLSQLILMALWVTGNAVV